ncbi:MULTISPECIES: CpsB/CapC family capsule biosynthesis tyrosine phosphatase [Clostridium]|uniref:CpsB/CapC family capsule biosynthesis tyrosine phosphatase n=1 Tax=Clostridium TaxID=1485 RepID=UPI000DCFC698|nr:MULTISPECIES: CpsB/CapC family capsule biosynthesis tyrosine phosphatase [Clostridium]MDU1568850.1 CpsB/CapC family capsule biosynthesis tyrosine phosphatase [Clostridium sp.]MDU2155636.1 CpsB/CapC family capsule biosynthesis tyrosine phosphatase [Clostridium sp.]MDU4738652.1 CpsB/CapC family capsule biosynthesis tyrosine phosphatase [Clostridium sp.]
MVFANLIFKELVIHGDFKSTVLLKKIDEAAKCNIKRLVLAPAYYDEDSKTTIAEVKKIVEELNSYLKVKNIDLTLYSGNLLRDNYENVKKHIEGSLGSINETNFVLLDVEESNKIDDLLEIVFEYKIRSLTPIIVSPEKMEEIIKDNKKIDKLLNEECLFQLDPGSLKGVHGKKIQKTAKALLKKDIYNFVGFEEKIEETYIDKSIEDLSKKSLFILNPEGARAKRIFKSTKKKKVAIFR